LFVDLYRQEEEEYAYELAVIYKCFKTGSRDIKVTIPYSQVDQVGEDCGNLIFQLIIQQQHRLTTFFTKPMLHLHGRKAVWQVKIVLDSGKLCLL
jgi:hypothetical protein